MPVLVEALKKMPGAEGLPEGNPCAVVCDALPAVTDPTTTPPIHVEMVVTPATVEK